MCLCAPGVSYHVGTGNGAEQQALSPAAGKVILLAPALLREVYLLQAGLGRNGFQRSSWLAGVY